MSFKINYPVPVIFGAGAYAETGQKLKECGITKVFCIYDRGIKAAGVVDKIIDVIIAEGIKVIEFDGVLPDPPDTVIDTAGEIGRREGVDAVVGIGGGSCLDAAKAVNIILGNPGSITKYYDFGVVQKPGKPLFLIPTTSGTGAEVTGVAVLTNTGNNTKQGVVGPNCTATLAIVDPTLTLALPTQLTASTGMDTFAHAVEALTSAMNNPMSDILALEAIALTAKYLPEAVKAGSNLEARSKMSLASTAAGMAFSNSFPHLGHAIGHTLGAKYHIPHGTACGLAVPGVIEIIAEVMPDKVRDIGQAMGLDFRANLNTQNLGVYVADAVRELNKKIGLPALSQLNIPESELAAVAAETLNDVCARNTPKSVTADDILKLLQKEYLTT